MTRLCYSLVAIALFPAVALPEGLLYQLPKDGHWVRFEIDDTITGPDGTKFPVVGTLTMSSVGTTKVDGQKCRWIEIAVEAKQSGKPFSHVDKLLIPEKHLGKGKEPLKHVTKAWRKSSGSAPQEIKDLAGYRARYPSTIRLFLHGPFETTEKLKPLRVDSKLGNLDCKGITCSEKIERNGMTIDSHYSIRLHPKAPFGVVGWEAQRTIERDGQAQKTITMKLKLADFGIDAKSVIPDAK